MRNLFLSIFFAILISGNAASQQQVKIMTYNLLNYPAPDTNVRNPYFRTILNATNPDILVVCEIVSQSGVNSFLSNVLNYSSVTYSAGTFIDGYDTDNAIFYKTSKFNFLGNTPINTALRDINEFKIMDKIYNDTLRIFSVHLKANASDSAKRSAEVDSLRKFTNQLPAGTDFIVTGDFNIYSSNESAYKKLILDNVNDDGNFNDALNLTGTWNYSGYAPYHTQSTRTRSFGDGATGGLDDRFDMILYSNAIKNNGGIKFIPGAYVSYGNDGLHFNDSINQIPNNSVSQTIANALHYASDHLPVYATFEFGNAIALNVKIIPEGFYNIAINKLNSKDTASVYLRKTTAPYELVDSAKAIIDSSTFICPAIFRRANKGTYFIVIKHRNSIETWSKAGGIQFNIESIMNYDFTNSQLQAYGNNLTLKGSKYCIFSGDVNQDGVIDAFDLSLIDNDAANFISGYVSTDISGDNVTDASDAAIADNNAANFITRIIP